MKAHLLYGGLSSPPQTLHRFLSHESTAVVHQSGRGHLEGRQDRGVEEKAGDLGFKKALRRSTDELCPIEVCEKALRRSTDEL